MKKYKKIIRPRFTSKKHTGSIVPVMAKGPGNEIAVGNFSNNGLGKRLRKLIRKQD